MKPIRKAAKKVMDILTNGLTNIGDHVTFDNAKGSFMAVHVELIDFGQLGPLFSVAHYYVQNSDLMRDPEMIFIRASNGNYYPTYFRQDPYIEQFSVRGERFSPKMQADHADFAGIWMKNIKEQQGL